MEFRKYDDVVILEDHRRLHLLARLLRNREERIIMMGIESEIERMKYLRALSGAHDNLEDLLDEAETLAKKHEAHKVKGKIGKDIEKYIIYAANWTMQCIRNFCIRETYVEKIKSHFDAMVKELEELNADDKDEVDDLTAMVDMYIYRMWEYGNTSRSTYARAQSRAFSQSLMMDSLTMEQLITRTKNRLGYREAFEDLEDSKKLEVYESVIIDSGRAKFPVMYKRKIRKTEIGDLMDYHGIAVLVVQAGVLVWDIFTAEHNVESVLRETMSLLADIADFKVGLIVGGKVTYLAANKAAGLLVASLAGFVAGAIAGFIFTVVSGFLLDAIFGSGGSREPPDMEGLKFQTAEMPDGMVLALELSHGKLLDD